MSNENTFSDELDKERQKTKELEQKVKGHLATESDLRNEIHLLRKRLADVCHDEEIKIPRSPISTTESGGNTVGKMKVKGGEAITDLHFSQLSPSGSSTGHGLNNSGSSCSFEVIERNSPPHLQGQKAAQNSSSGPDPTHSQPGNLKSVEHTSKRVPVQSSVQPDSRLTLHPAGREGNSSDLEKVNFAHHDVTKGEGTVEKGDLCEAYSWPQQSAPWNGTGARPKNNSFPTTNPRREDSERNPESEGQLHLTGTEPKEVQNSKMLVQIPKDGGTFRINHLPPFNYGQDVSMTGISSVFTNSDEEMPATPKHTTSETEGLELNDLNSGTSSSDKSLPPQMELLKKGNVDEVLNLPLRTKHPQEQEPLLISFASPFESIDAEGVIGQPQMTSEDNVDLARQLSDLVLEMKSKVLGAEEALNRVSDFAEEVARLEIRLKEYQAEIQKLQVHSSSLQGHSAEVQRLRNENQELRQLLQFPIQQPGIRPSNQEPGWITVAANEVECKQEGNKALEEELKKMSALNDTLFSVNKQWEESWNQREQQFATQQEDLVMEKRQLIKEKQQLMIEKQQLVTEKQQLKGETAVVNQLTEELKTLKHEKHELEQQAKVQESYLLKELQKNTQMKTKWDVYNTRGEMEIKEKKELKTEIVVLKEQLTITMDDYNKEKKDRTSLEDMLKKMRAEKSELKKDHDTRLKSANLMIKKREGEIFHRDKTIGDLKRTIDDLNAKLRTAERRTALQPPSLFQSGPSSDVFCPSASPAYNPSQMKVLQEQKELAENAGEILVSPAPGLYDGRHQAVASAEHSPENWACPNCTFINFSYRKNCGMCNSARLSDGSMLPSLSTLHSRDEWPGRDVPDSPEINVN